MPGDGSNREDAKSTWLVRGDVAATWYFAGATFAFAGAAWMFTSQLYLVGGLLMAAGAVIVAVGIWVWQRGFRRAPHDHDASAPTAPSSAPPPRI